MHEIREEAIKCKDSFQKDINNPEYKNSRIWKQATINVRKLNQVIQILK